MSYRPPELLGPAHELDAFSCSSAEQTDWLKHHARQSMATGPTKVFVVTAADGRSVVAYYAWTMAQIAVTDAPTRLRKGAGSYPQPVALLARLGVHRDHERQGLGAALLRDVIQRVAAISEDIGCRGLLVHCESQHARDFYLHLIPDLERSPTDELHLVLLLKDIKKTLQGNGKKRVENRSRRFRGSAAPSSMPPALERDAAGEPCGTRRGENSAHRSGRGGNEA